MGWGKMVLAGVFLLPLCVAAATGLGYLVNHWILGEDLWLVVDLLLGVVFGVPLFAGVFTLLVRRWRRPRLLEGPRRMLE
jgi:nitrate reductase gamma subunit